MDAKIFRVNYKSDFILTLISDAGWMTPFCIKFWTGAPSQAYYAQYDGTTYTNCAPVAGEPTKLTVQFDDHHLPIGDLKYQVAYHFTVADFPNDTEDEVLNQANITTEIDGETYQVMLDFTGDTAPEIQFSLPAYANEAQRIANELQREANELQREANEEDREDNELTRQRNEGTRIENELERVQEFQQMKGDLEQATRDASAAAENANEKAVYAKNQGDYAKQQGDYAKDQGDIAKADHLRAEEDHRVAGDDHTQAGNDHTQAGNDHTRAGEDHTQAGNDHTRAGEDHTQAGNDHTRAGEDHTRAESDHAAVEVYVESLGVFDLSKHNAVGGVLATYADLNAALTALNALESKYKYGGMSMKYVQSSDNKYVQYRLVSDSFNTTPSNWQKSGAEVSISQNTSTGHTDINVGGTAYPVASVEEVSQLGQEIYGGVSSIKNNTYVISKLAGYYNSSFVLVENADWLSYKVDISSFVGEKINIACATKGGWCGFELLDGTSSSNLKWTQDGETVQKIVPENAKYLYVSNKPLNFPDADVVIEVQNSGLLDSVNEIKSTITDIQDDIADIQDEMDGISTEVKPLLGDEFSLKDSDKELIDTTGYWTSAFSAVENSDFHRWKFDISDYIGATLKTRVATKGGWCGIELLDGTSSSNLKWTQDGETAERVIPQNAKYLYISNKPSFVSIDDVVINIRTKSVNENISDIENNIGNLSNLQTEDKNNLVSAINEINAKSKITFVGKKWVVIGDSRSAWMYNETNVYYSWIANEMGLIKDSANKQFKDSNGNAFIDYNGAAGSYLIKWIYNNEGPNPSLLDRVLISDPDVVTIYMGVNDYAFAYDPLGTMADNENTLSFYGNLKKAILSVYAKFPNAQIVYLTPQRFKGYPSFATSEEQNANGNTIDEYAQAIKDVCGYYSVPVIDVLHDGDYTPLITSQNTKYFIDGLHENPEGHKQIAKLLLTKLNTLFALQT